MIENVTMKEITVLYVEDEELPREAICRYLSTKVAAIHSASNGREGLDIFCKINPDVVITDLEMPQMSGVEMIRKIRGMEHCVPIIITTGYDDDEHRTDLADCTLIKPIILNELLSAMELCIRQKRSQT